MKLYFSIFLLLLSAALAACNPTPLQPPSNPNTSINNLPDLHLVGADLQKESLDAGIYTINLLMENLGEDTGLTFATQCYWECASPIGNFHLVEHSAENGIRSQQTPSIGTIRGFAMACEPIPSTLRLECQIDVRDDIEESNEANNTWSGTVGVPLIP